MGPAWGRRDPGEPMWATCTLLSGMLLAFVYLIGPCGIRLLDEISNFQTHIKDWYPEPYLWNFPQVNTKGPHWWLANTDSGNDSVPPGSKPLLEPMLTLISVPRHMGSLDHNDFNTLIPWYNRSICYAIQTYNDCRGNDVVRVPQGSYIHAFLLLIQIQLLEVGLWIVHPDFIHLIVGGWWSMSSR